MTEVIAPPVSVRTNLRGDHWRVGTPLGVEGSLSAPISPCEDLTDRGLTRLWGVRSNQTATGSEPASALSQIINAPKVPQKRLLLGLGRSQHHHRHRRPQDPPIIAVTAGYDARPDLSAAASCAENLWRTDTTFQQSLCHRRGTERPDAMSSQNDPTSMSGGRRPRHAGQLEATVRSPPPARRCNAEASVRAKSILPRAEHFYVSDGLVDSGGQP